MDDAKDAEQKLKDILAEILGVNPNDIDVLLEISDDGKSVTCKLVVKHPTPYSKDVCSMPNVLIPTYREKLTDNDIPNQDRNFN